MKKLQRVQLRMENYFELMDYWLLLPVILMTLIGLFVLNQVLLDGYGAGSWPSNFIKQFGAALVGLLLALLICLLDPPTLKLLAWLIYGTSILLLIYAKIDGYSLKGLTGADSWIRLPIVGSFQPSELAKVGIAMTSSEYFVLLKKNSGDRRKNALTVAAIYLLPFILITREPDFGTAFVILVMFLSTLFIWGIRWRYIAAFALLSTAALPLLWFFYFSPYQRGRVLATIFPGQDLAEAEHVEMALRAVASGGLSGNGSGLSVPVPVKESDFIYSAVSENLGFIGTTSLLILVLIFVVRAIYIAWRVAPVDLQSSYLVVSLIANMGFHFVENMGMNVGLLPTTGIPLPFVSNGGTSMVVNYLALGVMLNISMNQQSRALSFD